MIENIVQGIDIVVMAAIIFLPIIIGIKLNKVFNNNFWIKKGKGLTEETQIVPLPLII